MEGRRNYLEAKYTKAGCPCFDLKVAISSGWKARFRKRSEVQDK